MHFAVVGTGPAALLLAHGLSAHGISSLLIGLGQAPSAQCRHIHQLSRDCLAHVFTLCPDIGDAWIVAGDDSRIIVDRPSLEQALKEALPDSVHCHYGHWSVEDLTADQWHISLQSETSLVADYLVDASGRQRASIPWVERFLPEAEYWLNQSRPGHAYVSMDMDRVHLPGECLAEITDAGGIIMHRIAGGEQVRATLQLPSLVKGRAALEATIDQFRHGLMADILRDATVVGPVDTYGRVRAEWLQWDEGSIFSCPWLALGDALLTTPPRMGEGLAHILRQVQLIKQCLADGEPHYSLPRTLLADYAKQAWLKATVLETVNDVLSAKS